MCPREACLEGGVHDRRRRRWGTAGEQEARRRQNQAGEGCPQPHVPATVTVATAFSTAL